MKKPKIQYQCLYCKRDWDTEEEAEACPKWPYEILKDGDVLDFGKYRYGVVINVHDKSDWAGFSATRNLDYCIAKGHKPSDMYRASDGKSVCYCGAICGGPEKHNTILMSQKEANELVTDLTKRLAAAKRLQLAVTKMWANREEQV
jgi:hypothetical protein